MGNLEQQLGYARPTTSLLYQLSDMWRSPRGTVLRIQALALVAIALSFFLAVFGSCRRWSNRWIVQKGFLAAQVLSLSLGTYSIGLMQSSSVKSEMYPIWAVSLLTLFGCVDPVTTYIGLDYKGPFWKVIFQLCLYCGYVLLMSLSTISGVFGNIAIGVLSAITLVKGFHRSLALVLPSRTRNQLGELVSTEPGALAGDGGGLQVHLPVHRSEIAEDARIREWNSRTSMADVHSSCKHMVDKKRLEVTDKDTKIIEDVCLGYSLSHLLRRRFHGLDTAGEMKEKREKFEGLARAIDYNRTMKAVEVELGFLYEVFFTSNEFLHYYEAKTSSFWALASFIGICLVGVAAAIPGTMASRHRITYTGPGAGAGAGAAGAVVVNTTTADLVITLVILVSMALLQLVQLIGCWTSNWARVAFACEYAATQEKNPKFEVKYTTSTSTSTIGGQASVKFEWEDKEHGEPSWWWWWWMGLKAFAVTRMNWFDKFLWQDKLGQYSLVVAAKSWRVEHCMECSRIPQSPCPMLPFGGVGCRYWIRNRLPGMLGLRYIGQVLEELWASDIKGGAGVRLDDDVKKSITGFLCQIKSRRIGKWSSSLFVANGLDASYLPYSSKRPPSLAKQSTTAEGTTKSDYSSKRPPSQAEQSTTAEGPKFSDAYAFTHRVMVWHIATWYCEQAEEQEGSAAAAGGGDRETNHRRVATALSRYCAYLVVSAPELLPGPSAETKRAFDRAAWQTSEAVRRARNGLAAMLREPVDYNHRMEHNDAFWTGVYWGKRLRNELPTRQRPPEDQQVHHWEVLENLWVQTLLYAAPSGDVQAHMQHLSQGGEFITHLWALLYHIGIDKWEPEESVD